MSMLKYIPDKVKTSPSLMYYYILLLQLKRHLNPHNRVISPETQLITKPGLKQKPLNFESKILHNCITISGGNYILHISHICTSESFSST